MKLLKLAELIAEIFVVICLLGIVASCGFYTTKTTKFYESVILILIFFAAAVLSAKGYQLAEKYIEKYQ